MASTIEVTSHRFEAFVDLYAVARMTETRLKRLLERFREPAAVFGASTAELMTVDGVDSELAAAICSYRRSAELQRLLAKAEGLRAYAVSYLDEKYPQNLRDVPHMPPVLFVRGEMRSTDRLAVAVVGTRFPSPYGRQVAERLGRELAQAGVTVVSGLARGIDTAAHRGALAGGGRTVAVLGCGIDVCYPPENRRLVDEIVVHGAVMTEFTLGTAPLAMNFPKRNRIVSALAKAVVAVEAGGRSGVLNTVAWALEQGRDVYAVPGRITDPQSVGTNRLLGKGARPFLTVAELLSDLGVLARSPLQEPVRAMADEKPVLEFLGSDPVHIDDLSEGLGVPMAELLSRLLEMELKGIVRQLPGKYFIRA